jgi:hypothetical protein
MMEIYLGGRRTTVTFQAGGAASAAQDDCPDCHKNESVIRRPL